MYNGYNKTYAMATPREQWVREHAHLGNTATLQADYDKLVGKPKEEEKPKVATKPKAKKKG